MSDNLQWDFPVFKILRKNETSEAEGNVGGFLIRKEIQEFFPELIGNPTPTQPTIGVQLTAALYFDGRFLGLVKTIYRKQTRGSKRSGEHRITSNLGVILDRALTDDVMLMQRHKSATHIYRLEVISRAGPDYEQYSARIGDRTTGVLDTQLPPQSLGNAYAEARQEELLRETAEFELFDKDPIFNVSELRKLARSTVFRKTVLAHYGYQCVLCGSGMRTADGMSELDAAHVVPRSNLGVDDLRNGLALCKPHHWAFDLGLWTVAENGEFQVSPTVLDVPENHRLVALATSNKGNPIKLETAVHSSALAWHRKNVFRATLPEIQLDPSEEAALE